jgi:hypothetical protein
MTRFFFLCPLLAREPSLFLSFFLFFLPHERFLLRTSSLATCCCCCSQDLTPLAWRKNKGGEKQHEAVLSGGLSPERRCCSSFSPRKSEKAGRRHSRRSPSRGCFEFRFFLLLPAPLARRGAEEGEGAAAGDARCRGAGHGPARRGASGERVGMEWNGKKIRRCSWPIDQRDEKKKKKRNAFGNPSVGKAEFVAHSSPQAWILMRGFCWTRKKKSATRG